MIRVCCVFGTWQLMTLVASLRQAAEDDRRAGRQVEYEDYLLLYETRGVPDSFKATLLRMAETVWPWKRIVSAYDVLTARTRFPGRLFAELLATLRERVGVPPEGVAEAWVCWLTRPTEKLVFGAFPNARIVVYEDGLITYLPIRVAEHLAPSYRPANPLESIWRRLGDLREARQPAWRLRRSRRMADPRDLSRVRGAYTLLSPDAALPDALAAVPRRDVEDALLRETLASAAAALPPDAAAGRSDLPADGPRLLLLGQALARNGVLSRAEERILYESAIESALDRGYAVLWKEHPRIGEPYFDELKGAIRTRRGDAAADRLRQLSLPHAYPIELVAGGLDLAGCAAGSSAALFYLRRLYGIPCYTFAGDFLPRLRGGDAFMAEMVARAVPPLSGLPNAPSPASKAGTVKTET